MQATAAFGFGEAYHNYVRPLQSEQFDRFYLEGIPASVLYGVANAPRSRAAVDVIFEDMRSSLEPSECIFEFLRIMNDSAAFPRPFRWMQRILVRAAVDLIPAPIRDRLALTQKFGLAPWQRPAANLAGSMADRIVLPHAPAAQACLRLGYPVTHLYDEVQGKTDAQVIP